METIKRRIVKLLCLFVAFMCLAGCSAEDKKVQWEKKDNIVFGTTVTTKSLDPANGYCGWFLARYGVGETLFVLDDKMEPTENLATGYEMINSNKWKINIRKNVYFQNGREMTPEKVKQSLDRTIKNNSRAEVTLKIKDIAVEKDCIIINTYEENPTLINDLCDPFACIIDVEGKDFDTKPIGTGPFMVEQFNHSKASYFKRNANYWNGVVKLNELKVMKIGDSDTLAMALQSGEIDVAQGLSISMVNMLKQDENYKVESIDTSRTVVMYFNDKNENLHDKNVRKAVNMLIDKEKYVSAILKGEASSAVGAFPDYENNSALKAASFNKEAAVSILNSAGYYDSDNDGFLDKDGRKLKFKLVTYSSRAELSSIAQSIQNDLKKAGIDVSVEISDNIDDILKAGQFDLCLYSNVTSPTGDELSYLNNAVKTDGTSNYGHYSSSETDKLIDEMKVEFDMQKRRIYADEIIQTALNDDAYNFIAHMKMSFVMKNNVTGIKPHQTDYYQFTAETDIK